MAFAKLSKRALAIIASCALVLCMGALVACGGKAASYKDGTYTAQSSVYEDSEDGNGNGYGVIEITIKDGKISAADFKTYEVDGTLKDKDYGKGASGQVSNQDFYNKAQKAVAACSEYADQLVSTGHVDAVDVISGATISHDEFVEAANDALKQASK